MRLAMTLMTVVLVATGCATTPTPIEAAKPVPASRQLAFQEPKNRGDGRLTFVRDEGMIASMCYLGLTLNGTLAARLGTGESVVVYAPVGELVMRVGADPSGRGTCGFDKDWWVQRETLIRSDEVKRFRISISANGTPDIQRAD